MKVGGHVICPRYFWRIRVASCCTVLRGFPCFCSLYVPVRATWMRHDGLVAARIAEPRGILPVAERIGIGLAVDATERSANVDRRNDQIDASKISGRRRTRH